MNNKQFEGIGTFLLDIGKSLVIGNIGIVVLTPARLISTVFGSLIAIGCVYAGLYFLGRIK